MTDLQGTISAQFDTGNDKPSDQVFTVEPAIMLAGHEGKSLGRIQLRIEYRLEVHGTNKSPMPNVVDVEMMVETPSGHNDRYVDVGWDWLYVFACDWADDNAKRLIAVASLAASKTGDAA